LKGLAQALVDAGVVEGGIVRHRAHREI
jgi:hypothetical protein